MTSPTGASLDDGDQFPEPFREISESRVRYAFLVALVVCFGIIVSNVVRENDLLPDSAPWVSTLLALKLMSNDAAFTLFTALLGGYLGYRQFALSQRPYLSYNGVRASTASFNRMAEGRFYTVVLRNGGGGPAQVIGASYCARLTNGKAYEGRHYSELMRFLHSNGVVEGQDFVMFRLSPGETIRAGGDWLILEIDEAAARAQIDALDITIDVSSVVGGRYSRQVYCIPRRWRLDRVSPAAAASNADPTHAIDPGRPINSTVVS